MKALVWINAIFILIVGIGAFFFGAMALKRGDAGIFPVILLVIIGCLAVYHGIKNLFAP